MNKKKRTLMFLLALTTMLVLAGCGDGNLESSQPVAKEESVAESVESNVSIPDEEFINIILESDEYSYLGKTVQELTPQIGPFVSEGEFNSYYWRDNEDIMVLFSEEGEGGICVSVGLKKDKLTQYFQTLVENGPVQLSLDQFKLESSSSDDTYKAVFKNGTVTIQINNCDKEGRFIADSNMQIYDYSLQY